MEFSILIYLVSLLDNLQWLFRCFIGLCIFGLVFSVVLWLTAEDFHHGEERKNLKEKATKIRKTSFILLIIFLIITTLIPSSKIFTAMIGAYVTQEYVIKNKDLQEISKDTLQLLKQTIKEHLPNKKE